MKRKFYQKLISWKQNNINMPLMVIGARQIGKTYIIEKFAKENFDNFIYINLEYEEEIRKKFEETIKPNEILKYIELIFDQSIDIDNTLIFFDEIQVSERAITSLKYFNEAKENYKIICAGSLLGVKLNRFNSSFPVGKIRIETMYPMDFEEFLLACNKDLLVEEIKNCFNNKKETQKEIHQKALNLYREFLCIGGMPAAVKNYIYNNFDVMKFDRSIHENIIAMYLADMRKYTYTSSETLKIQNIYEAMPLQLGKENKKFKYSIVDKNATKRNFETPLDWLISSNMLIKCKCVKKIETPLRAYVDNENFKMYLSDVGILNTLAKQSFRDIILDNNFMFKGAITENYVATNFVNKNYDLLFWKSNNQAEVDFILQTDYGIVPVEVKSSNNTVSKSLNEYIKKYSPKISIRISAKNFGYKNNIFNVPLYAAHLI